MDEVLSVLRACGIPFAYHHFAEGECPEPPFICYWQWGSDNFAADGGCYFKASEFHIELYTDKKDPDAEARVESALDAAGAFYSKTESWIEAERLYQVLFILQTKG